jgi:hypothetical protein
MRQLFSYCYLCSIEPGCKITMTVIFKLFQEEPGGQRALIFDQGNRISQVKHHEQLVACVMLNFADCMLYRTLYLELSYVGYQLC